MPLRKPIYRQAPALARTLCGTPFRFPDFSVRRPLGIRYALIHNILARRVDSHPCAAYDST
jgi:hypothetical protein